MAEPSKEIKDKIVAAGLAASIEPALVMAHAEVESGFDPNAVGDVSIGGSYGLLQLYTKGAGAGHTPDELLDVDTNLAIGCAYIRGCQEQTGNLMAGISAFNQGVGGYNQNGIINWRYVALVLNAYTKWKVRLMQEACLPHIDSCYGYVKRRQKLNYALNELIAAKHAIGL